MLRNILMARSLRTVPSPALYLYVPDEQWWYLNVECYPNGEQALQFLQREKITLSKWRDFAGIVRQKNLERVNEARKKKGERGK